MAKRVLILVGIPDFDYTNQHSAVVLFLNQIRLTALENGWVAAFPPQESVPLNEVNPGKKKSVMKQILRSWKWGYHSLAFYRYKKRQKALLNSLSVLPAYDCVVEFHTVGSTIGKQLAEKWKANLSIIFDSPVAEQFLEMKKTKSAFWSAIQQSEYLSMEAADKIMAYSPACADYLKERYTLRAEPVILPCVVNKPAPQNGSSKEPFNILFIGSFLSWHKVDLLVKAFEQLLNEIPNARLQLIGFGEEWKVVKKSIADKKLENQVEMPGFVNEEELLRYKKEATVGIMPGSNWYGSPLKLFEYAAAGIPFLAPKTPTIASIFSEEHCWLIDKHDPVTSIYKGLKKMEASATLRAKKSQKAQAFYQEKFAPEIYRKNLHKALFPEQD